jgi:hypothetical protein
MRSRPCPLAAAAAAPPEARVTPGVDTHAEVHVGVALDHLGRVLGNRTVPTTPADAGPRRPALLQGGGRGLLHTLRLPTRVLCPGGALDVSSRLDAD